LLGLITTHIIGLAVAAFAMIVLGALNAFSTLALGGVSGAFNVITGVGHNRAAAVFTQTTGPLGILPLADANATGIGDAVTIVGTLAVITLGYTVLGASFAVAAFSRATLAVLGADLTGLFERSTHAAVGVTHGALFLASIDQAIRALEDTGHTIGSAAVWAANPA
jgi:hypothetical protein